MSEVLQANIFFFITSVAVVVLTILLVAVLVYVLMIVRNVKDITDRLKEGSELIASDLAAFRERLYGAGNRLQGMGAAILGRLFSRSRRARRSAKREEESES